MKAMILAAGRGKRLQPLTDTTPKPLLKVRGKPLIEWHIERLKAAGFTDLVVNVCWLKEQLMEFLGDGSRWDVRLNILQEPEGALETGGGIYNALPLLGETFAVVNADIWTDFAFAQLNADKLNDKDLAHLVLVPNPPQHTQGDFLLANNRLVAAGGQSHTFSGIGIYRAKLFDNCKGGAFKLAPLIENAITQQRVSGELYTGEWSDIGTAERLQVANEI